MGRRPSTLAAAQAGPEQVADRFAGYVAGDGLVDEQPVAERRARLVDHGHVDRHSLPRVCLDTAVQMLREQRPRTALVLGFS